jgi:hypothetical protein
MAEKIILDIPTGFRIINMQKAVDYTTACELLSSKRQRYYKKAEKKDGQIVLYWQKIKCPNCGSEFSPYKFTKTDKNRVSKPRIYDWTECQLSFFKNNNSILYIGNDFDGLNRTPLCFKCGCRATVSDNSERIVVESDNETIQVSRVSPKENTVFERITFNFKTGETLFINKGQTGIVNGFIVCSEEKNYLKEKTSVKVGVLDNLISNNTIVKRNLRRLFQEKWTAKIPYDDKELTLETFALMTKFMNFNRRFYEAIPYDNDSTSFEKSFDYITNSFRDEQSVIKMLKESSLPNCKSVKKLFFQRPELIFYISECEFMYEIIGDVNLFCRVFSNNDIIQVLICIHIYPLTKEFYKDYLEIIGKQRFCKQITSNAFETNHFARNYCALSDYGKEREKKRWKKETKNDKGSELAVFSIKQYFSTPMHPVDEDIKDCTINGYSFKWLRTKREYAKAGEQLVNCLKIWRICDSPVVAVSFNRITVAAIEVRNKEIVQAFKSHNDWIEEDSSLGKAVAKWKKKYQLDYCEDELPY